MERYTVYLTKLSLRLAGRGRISTIKRSRRSGEGSRKDPKWRQVGKEITCGNLQLDAMGKGQDDLSIVRTKVPGKIPNDVKLVRKLPAVISNLMSWERGRMISVLLGLFK